MQIVISGSSGLVGSTLCSFLQGCGHTIKRLVRGSKRSDLQEVRWDPETGEIDSDALEGVDAVIHLAGDNIANACWTAAKKQSILDSRVKSTNLLNKTLRNLKRPPKIFISASATGYYGDMGDTCCTEESPNGKGFLADVCRQWEDAATHPKLAETRTVILRFGIILSPKGGALAKMLPAFKCGVGGMLGNGKQWMSWISIEDVMAIILFAVNHNALAGPVNVISPHPITNKVFTKVLGQILHRPTFFSVPSFILKMLLGKEMAEEFLLSSVRAKPLKLELAGYSFIYPTLEVALGHLLKN